MSMSPTNQGEDVMRLDCATAAISTSANPRCKLRFRHHIARCLRDYPHGCEGVITLAGVEHCFMYVVNDDVVDTVIGPPDYIEQALNERRQNVPEAQSPLPRKEQNRLGLRLGRDPAARAWDDLRSVCMGAPP
jgi:hypothetical protein